MLDYFKVLGVSRDVDPKVDAAIIREAYETKLTALAGIDAYNIDEIIRIHLTWEFTLDLLETDYRKDIASSPEEWREFLKLFNRSNPHLSLICDTAMKKFGEISIESSDEALVENVQKTFVEVKDKIQEYLLQYKQISDAYSVVSKNRRAERHRCDLSSFEMIRESLPDFPGEGGLAKIISDYYGLFASKTKRSLPEDANVVITANNEATANAQENSNEINIGHVL